jgi:hypothetical protein
MVWIINQQNVLTKCTITHLLKHYSLILKSVMPVSVRTTRHFICKNICKIPLCYKLSYYKTVNDFQINTMQENSHIQLTEDEMNIYCIFKVKKMTYKKASQICKLRWFTAFSFLTHARDSTLVNMSYQINHYKQNWSENNSCHNKLWHHFLHGLPL